MMNRHTLILLAALAGLSLGVQAKSARFKGGGSHHHAEPAGGGHALPTPRVRSTSDTPPVGSTAQASPAEPRASTNRQGMTDRLNAELAAQRAATPSATAMGRYLVATNNPTSTAPPVAPKAPEAATPAQGTQPAKAAPLPPMPPVDLSTLVPKDSARQFKPDARNSEYRYDARGVNCTLYPARCP